MKFNYDVTKADSGFDKNLSQDSSLLIDGTKILKKLIKKVDFLRLSLFQAQYFGQEN